ADSKLRIFRQLVGLDATVESRAQARANTRPEHLRTGRHPRQPDQPAFLRRLPATASGREIRPTCLCPQNRLERGPEPRAGSLWRERLLFTAGLGLWLEPKRLGSCNRLERPIASEA